MTDPALNISLVIRSATQDDLPILRQFEQGVIEAERPFSQNIRQGDIQYYDLPKIILDEAAELLVAQDGDELVASGYIQIKPEKPHFSTDDFAYIGFLYVVPEKRGEGIIIRLVESLMQWARDKGVTSFKLDVYATNSSAVRAYEKLGFKPDLVQMLKME